MASTEVTAWVDGHVFTGHRRVQALLVDGGRVVAAGSSADVRRHRPTGTSTRPLGGRTMIPGLVDSHCHLRTSVLLRHGVDLSTATSVDDAVERLRVAAADSTGPILGWGWDETRFQERRYPTRQDLDRIATDRPIVAYRRCLHVASASSAALESIHLAENARDPPGGHLGRLGARLNGVLYDAALSSLSPVESLRFDALGEELERWLHGAAAHGLTTLVAMSATVEELRRIRDAASSGRPPVRVRAYVRADQLAALDAAPELRASEELRVTGIKAFADGALGARTAWLSEPYSDAPDSSGESRAEPSELGTLIRSAADRDLAVAVHAIGDRAIRQTLRVFRTEPPFGVPRIEHASVTPPELLTELAAVRPAIVVQPSYVPSDGWVPERLGPERARWTYAFRSLISLGLHVAGSSDAPVESADPWVGMAAATAARPGPSDLERLPSAAALGLYTHEAGAALGEAEIGSLEPGAFGDFVVLDSDDWPAALREGAASIVATYRGGHPTFERDPAQ